MLAALILSLLVAQADRLTVYVFTTTDCPISNRYAPEIKRLAAKFDRQAKFVLVYPVPTDSPDLIREHARKFAYPLETMRDPEQKLVKQTGVKVTPEAAVMRGSTVLYRGRIDDRYVDFGKDRPVPTERDLDDALTAITAGKTVAVRETQAIGCIIADLVK
jgi:thiol-disulfide isomerase/thioredoxin